MRDSAPARTVSASETMIPELELFLKGAADMLIDKEAQLRMAWCCLVAGGHLLIEDVPGVGKTTMVKLIARLFDLPFKRIQCTSDLLPSDIIGGLIYDETKREFSFLRGPIFTNLVMADELNRASPRSQSAFLQAMEEGYITVDGVSYELPSPFLVVATQNGADSAGTNPLPESQMDRFMMAMQLGLPARSGEKRLLTQPGRAEMLDRLTPVFSPNVVATLRAAAQQVHVSDAVADYILDLAAALRECTLGCSPRAVLALTSAGKAWALGCGRQALLPRDIQAVASAVLTHRLRPKSESWAGSSSQAVTNAISRVKVDC
jgi:MoxR-like ATPase